MLRGSPISERDVDIGIFDSECLESTRLYWPRFNGELRIDSLFARSSNIFFLRACDSMVTVQLRGEHVLFTADAETPLFTNVVGSALVFDGFCISNTFS